MSVLFGASEKRYQGWIGEPVVPPPGGLQRSPLNGVNLARADAAMQKVAVFASVNLLGTIAGMIPVDVFTGKGAEKRQIDPPASFLDPEAKGHGLGDWLYQHVYATALRGNWICRVMDRDRYGKPTVLVPQHPDTARPWYDEKTGRLRWRFNGLEVPADEVFHRRAYPIPGSPLGLSPIALHALTIGQGLSAAQFGLQWFLDGAHPSGMLTNENQKEITQESANTLKARFVAAIRGTREPVVLTGGWKYQQIQIAPGESQFLETQRYTASECARIFGPGMPEMLGYDTGHSMTYANVEQRSLDLLTYTVDPWLVRIERMLSDLLPGPYYARFNRKALLRTDALSRFQVHQIALENQIETVNEVRDVEDMPPVPWGDKPVPHIKPDTTAKTLLPDEAAPFPDGDPSEGSHLIDPKATP